MDHNNRPRTLPEILASTSFPVYGLIDCPYQLTLKSNGLGISHLSNLISVSLQFTNERTSSDKRIQKFEITTLDRTVESSKREHMPFDLQDPSDITGTNHNAHRLFRKYHINEEEKKQASDPFVLEKTLSIAGTSFSLKVHFWEQPSLLSLFLLKSEQAIIIGDGYGLSLDELLHILSGLQIIKGQNNIIQQYEHEKIINAIHVVGTC